MNAEKQKMIDDMKRAIEYFKSKKNEPNRCCGRCDGVNDICVTDMVCDLHNEVGCERCFGIRNTLNPGQSNAV